MSHPDRIFIERDGMKVTLSQAMAVDRLCGGVHHQAQPFTYWITQIDNSLDIWVRVGKRDYLISPSGMIAFSTIGELKR